LGIYVVVGLKIRKGSISFRITFSKAQEREISVLWFGICWWVSIAISRVFGIFPKVVCCALRECRR